MKVCVCVLGNGTMPIHVHVSYEHRIDEQYKDTACLREAGERHPRVFHV
jgi:hypothetical protein